MTTFRAAAAIIGLAMFTSMAIPVMRGDPIAFDLPVRAAVHQLACPALTVTMRIVTMIGSQYFLVPLAMFLVGRWYRRRQRKAAYLFVGGSLTAEALGQLIKTLIHRPRPEVFFGLVPAETYSFPSGHSFLPAVYFGILVVALAAGTRWRVAVVVLALVLGFSRVYLGYHYPSDVVAGWGLAMAWLALWPIIADRHAASPA